VVCLSLASRGFEKKRTGFSCGGIDFKYGRLVCLLTHESENHTRERNILIFWKDNWVTAKIRIKFRPLKFRIYLDRI
jgi:hypothetical protein